MNSVRSILIRCAAGAALFACAGMAAAQYMWVDAKGIKQFSDQPPPPSIPLKNILKAPKGQPSAATEAQAAAVAAAAAAASAPAAPAAPAAAPAAKGPLTLAEREMDFQKRKKEREEQESKDKVEAARKATERDECARTRAARAVLGSGARITTSDASGQRSVMSDGERATETARIDKQLLGCPAR